MRRRRASRRYNWWLRWSALAGAAGLAAAVGMLVLVAWVSDRNVPLRPGPAPPTGPGQRVLLPYGWGWRPADAPGQPGTVNTSRRLPVAGAAGFFVVINADGTSYLESPTGKQALVSADFTMPPSAEQALAARLAARANRPTEAPRKARLEQLVVLDHGVVDVPRGATITLVTADYLVVLNQDGTSTVYYVDGRSEVRGRQETTRAGRGPFSGGHK